MSIDWNVHQDLEGHAFLSPSKFYWLRYEDEEFDTKYISHMAAKKGTELHDFAATAIRLGIKLNGPNKALKAFVNDAIGFRMEPEQKLYYSPNCFGTADAISFRRNTLRIFDLKTGIQKPKMDQLLVYASLFCLEYNRNPPEIAFQLRIYQGDMIEHYEPTSQEITTIMRRIVYLDKRIEDINKEG
jgi:hypothetical protein